MDVSAAELVSVFAVLDSIDAATGPTELGVYMTGLGDAIRERFLLDPVSESRNPSRAKLLAARPPLRIFSRRDADVRPSSSQ
jgi:hypothetical protein